MRDTLSRLSVTGLCVEWVAVRAVCNYENDRGRDVRADERRRAIPPRHLIQVLLAKSPRFPACGVAPPENAAFVDFGRGIK